MTNVEGKVPMSTKTKIGWLAAVILPAMILLVPESEALTLQIKLFLAVTLCAILIFALELMDNVIPALMLPLCYYALKLVPLTTAFQPWTTTIPWMCLGGFILTNIMLRTGLLKRVAYWCIVKTGGTYKGIIWGLIFFGIVFNLVKPGASFVAMSAFAYGLCTALGLGRSKAAAGIMIAASFATLVPGYFIYTPANVGMLLGIGASVTDTAVTYFEFMKHNIVFIPFIFIMAWLLTKMFKPEKPIDGKAFFLEEQRKLGKMSKDELKTAIAMIALFLCMLTNIVDIGFAFVVIPCLLFFPGINVGTKEDMIKINYGFLIFVTACMSIGSVATALGVGKMISAMVLPFMTNMNTTGIIVVVYILGVGLNFLLTPLAAMATFGAPLTQLAVDLGINPIPMLYTFFYSLDQILLPYEHAQYLLFFSYGLFTMQDFMKAFGAKMVLNFVYLLCIAVPYWMFIGLL